MIHELVVSAAPDAPLIAAHREVPGAVRAAGVRGGSRHRSQRPRAQRGAAAATCSASASCATDDWEARGPQRGGRIVFEQSSERGIPGAGTVHHIAWAVLRQSSPTGASGSPAPGARPTPVIDRFWFESVYFREPGGILYELATLDGAGFDADETPDALGEKLVLPPFLEAQRAQIEPRLTPLPDPTVWRPQTARRHASDRRRPMSAAAQDLGFAHVFEPGSSDWTLLLLHGTGGDEHDLVGLGRQLAPEAALLSPRGQVLEHGYAAVLSPARGRDSWTSRTCWRGPINWRRSSTRPTRAYERDRSQAWSRSGCPTAPTSPRRCCCASTRHAARGRRCCGRCSPTSPSRSRSWRAPTC